jgi:hypothetical protein
MIVYLAVPYSHPDPEVRIERFKAANRMAGKLMHEGVHVFSPISHTHPIAVECGLPLGFDFWREYDEKILRVCGKIVVLTIDGWSESKGVKSELEFASKLGLQIEYREP